MTFPIVVAGVDGTRAGFEAVRQAGRLVDPGGRLLLAGVYDEWDALAARWGDTSFAPVDELEDWPIERRQEELRRRIDASLVRAAEQVPAVRDVETRRLTGKPWDALRDLAAAESAALIAVGTHGDSRLKGIVMGQTAIDLAHDAPCSLLIARPPFDPARFPASLVVGIDGSEGARRALEVAIAIAARQPGIEARAIACDPVAPGLLRAEVRPALPEGFGYATLRQRPDRALVEASHAVDLVVVGARGVSGLRALGSVSERVASRAGSSVLIVRG